MTDVFDLDCLIYRQTLNITTRVLGGTLSPSDFLSSVFQESTLLSGDRAGSASGIEVTNPRSGVWRIAASSQPGYTPMFSGDCDASGMLPMGFNIYARCTITQTFAESTVPTPPSPGSETGYLMCGDAIDNDGDGMTDVFDLDCLDFRQTAEIITRISGGTAVPSDAMMRVRFSNSAQSDMLAGSANIVEVTNPTTGTWRLVPTALQNYTPSLSGDCNASGDFSMGFNMRKQCVVIYTFNG